MPEWYLKTAYEIYLDSGVFDAVAFVENFNGVFRPGESEQDAERRRGEIDLDALKRNVAEGVSVGDVGEPDPEPTTDPTPEPAQETTTGDDTEPDTESTGTENGATVDDLKDRIRDRMDQV